MACELIRKEREKTKSDRTACRNISEHLGVPVPTVRMWLSESKSKVDGKPSIDKVPINKDFHPVSTLEELIKKCMRFSTIYTDPPWNYGNQGTRSATSNHYETQDLEWLKALPVKELTADKAHLHLWTTNAFLFDAKELLEAWGFTYKSCFIWVKPTIGMGNYWRVSHEFLLLGVKGNMTFQDKSLRSWMEIKRGKHSEKPELVRELIMKGSPSPYLELFARKIVPGWTVWGNQIVT